MIFSENRHPLRANVAFAGTSSDLILKERACARLEGWATGLMVRDRAVRLLTMRG